MNFECQIVCMFGQILNDSICHKLQVSRNMYLKLGGARRVPRFSFLRNADNIAE
jgi:hypothetical protein